MKNKNIPQKIMVEVKDWKDFFEMWKYNFVKIQKYGEKKETLRKTIRGNYVKKKMNTLFKLLV